MESILVLPLPTLAALSSDSEQSGVCRALSGGGWRVKKVLSEEATFKPRLEVRVAM